MGTKVEFPIGKKLFHLVFNPGTSRCPTVDLELVQTTRNVNGTRHSVRKFQPGNGPTFLDCPLFLGIFQSDEPRKRVPFTSEPEIPEIFTKWKAPPVYWRKRATVPQSYADLADFRPSVCECSGSRRPLRGGGGGGEVCESLTVFPYPVSLSIPRRRS